MIDKCSLDCIIGRMWSLCTGGSRQGRVGIGVGEQGLGMWRIGIGCIRVCLWIGCIGMIDRMMGKTNISEKQDSSNK